MDLKDERQVSEEEVSQKSEELKIAYCETSALEGYNIDYAFDTVVEQVTKKNNEDNNNEIRSEDKSKGLVLDTGLNKEENTDTKCCGN